jgi:hypothetical protein
MSPIKEEIGREQSVIIPTENKGTENIEILNEIKSKPVQDDAAEEKPLSELTLGGSNKKNVNDIKKLIDDLKSKPVVKNNNSINSSQNSINSNSFN